ncbi:hypothetical protein BC669P2_00037 [Bacteroides phage BC669P2]|nr:hypothetical protein BC669P2_00037 [Bacteroides phage BC669P2]
MACIKALDKAIQYNCELGAVGLGELYLINFADITDMTVSAANFVTAITLKAGAKTVPVDTVKNGAKVVEAMKATEVSNGIDQTLTITLYEKTVYCTLIIDALMNGRFMAAVRYKDIKSSPNMLGALCGLEISDIQTDSSANGGFTTITLKTPDDAKGEKRTLISSETWTTIVNAKLI